VRCSVFGPTQCVRPAGCRNRDLAHDATPLGLVGFALESQGSSFLSQPWALRWFPVGELLQWLPVGELQSTRSRDAASFRAPQTRDHFLLLVVKSVAGRRRPATKSQIRNPKSQMPRRGLTRKNHQPSAATCGRQAGAALGLDCGADGMFSYSPSTILRPPCSSLPRAASRDEVGDLSGLRQGVRGHRPAFSSF